MTIAFGILLLLNALYNVVVWPRFYTRIAKDPRARNEAGKAQPFLIVHVVLIAIALVLAAVSAVFGVLAFFQ